MREILIAQPLTNTDPYRNYSLQDKKFTNETEVFMLGAITPGNYPKAIDLCSGDGALALFLIQRGWKPENITCVDRYISPTPLVTGVSWLYMDLNLLATALETHEPVPSCIGQLRGAFDVVTHIQGYLQRDEQKYVNEFFIRDKGYLYGYLDMRIVEK
jgi:hypothetical protein